MTETINLGALTLKFLHSKEDTAGSADIFELTLQPGGRMPVPHYHESWDEIVYGLTGTTTWNIDGRDVDVVSGESVFIRRGVVHGFTNRTAAPASCLCTLTPGVLGPSYFKEMAALLAGGATDPEKMKATMLRYGLIPAPPKPA